jgi:uncharacterized membrane protein
MNNKIIVGLVALFAVTLYIGTISAHSYGVDAQDDYREHHEKMMELHEQYANGEITEEEFWEQMEDDEFHRDGYGCHSGFGMMGFPIMGMMW